MCFWTVPLLTRSTSGLVFFCGSNKGVWSWSAGHYGLIWFANLFRGRFASGSLIRVSTESDPYKPKIRQKCIRYGDFGAKSPVPFTPPGPPPGPPPVLLPLAACKAAFGGLSLSLSFSRNMSRRERIIVHRRSDIGSRKPPFHSRSRGPNGRCEPGPLLLLQTPASRLLHSPGRC